MNSENTRKLIEAGPHLYGDRFYFECGDGWYHIILEATKKIESILRTYPESIRQDIVASQVKEKYGTIRFYISYYTEELDEIINELESQSAKTCEVCGGPGSVRGRLWLYTACSEHTRTEDREQSPTLNK